MQVLAQSLCDYYAVDHKAPQSRYHEICDGNTNANANAGSVLATIGLLIQPKADFEVRITMIPTAFAG